MKRALQNKKAPNLSLHRRVALGKDSAVPYLVADKCRKRCSASLLPQRVGHQVHVACQAEQRAPPARVHVGR